MLINPFGQETLNFWKQISHVMKYFREDENPTARLPENFMQSFLEVSVANVRIRKIRPTISRAAIENHE